MLILMIPYKPLFLADIFEEPQSNHVALLEHIDFDGIILITFTNHFYA